MGKGVVWFQIKRATMVVDGLIKIPLSSQAIAEVVVRFSHIRIHRQGLSIVADRLIHPVHRRQRHAERPVRLGR